MAPSQTSFTSSSDGELEAEDEEEDELLELEDFFALAAGFAGAAALTGLESAIVVDVGCSVGQNPVERVEIDEVTTTCKQCHLYVVWGRWKTMRSIGPVLRARELAFIKKVMYNRTLLSRSMYYAILEDHTHVYIVS